jgi:uncharacterized protein with GYD domain
VKYFTEVILPFIYTKNINKEMYMGLLDNLKDKAKDIMDDPEAQEKIKKIAEEKGITLEAAKEKFLNKDDAKEK